MKITALSTAAISTAPVLLDLLGVRVPALSLVTGLLAVVLVRIMLMAKEVRRDVGFWYYNIALTLLMVVITFCIIADRQLSPGPAVIAGVGIGASGMVLVDILKDRVQSILRAAIGKSHEPETPSDTDPG
jgi:hypothetical protein